VAHREPEARRGRVSVRELDVGAHRILEAGTVRIIDQRRQAEFIRQVEGSQTAAFDPKHIPQYGKQMGAKYVITGHVSGNDERSEDMRRVQYFLYLEVVNVATSEKLGLWKSEITKAVR
jgi:hypothetical protein